MTGPRRRTALEADPGLNYAAIGATMAQDVLAFPPEGFRAAEYRHRAGSGAHRFATAGRSLMTWSGLRAAGFRIEDVRAEPVEHGSSGPRFLEDGTPWITPGMTARVGGADADAWSGPMKVVRVVDEPGRIGYILGSMPGHASCVEQLLLLEHDAEDAVWATLRSLWQAVGSRWTPAAKRAETRQRRIDERIVRALHPSYSA